MSELNNLLLLTDICKSHLGVCFAVARRNHAIGKLPLRAFRLGNNKRGPLYVHRDDLDDLIARRRKGKA